MTKRKCPAPGGNRRQGGVDAAVSGTVDTTELAQAQRSPKGIFSLQVYRVLSHPAEKLMAITDPITVRMLGRIAKGKADCVLCRVCLNLDSKSDTSPGLIGYWHGDFAEGVEAIGVVACCKCVLDLGNEEVARTIGEMFVNEKCGGGTVEMVQGGVA
jgi:hypothetical protein